MKLFDSGEHMKRSSRIQTVITPLHRKKLDTLSERYGTMNEVIERGIELLEEMETETDILETEDEIRELRRKSDLFDALSSFSGFVLTRSSTIDDLFNVLTEGLSMNDFVQRQRNWVAEDLEIQKILTQLAQTYTKNFASLVEIIQQVSDTFRSYYVMVSSESERKVVIQPNCFHKFPEIIGAQLQGILEFLGFNITYRKMNDRLLLEWPESGEKTTIVDENTDMDLDSRFGLLKDFRAQLESYTKDTAKSEKLIYKDIVTVASNFEIPRWNKGLFTTGNKRFTYMPQEFIVDFLDEIAIKIPTEKTNQILQDIGDKLHSINKSQFQSSKSSLELKPMLSRLKSLINDILGWGTFEILKINLDNAEFAIQSPFFSTAIFLEIFNGYFSSAGYRTNPNKTIEQGHYRGEFLVTKSDVKLLIVDDEKRVLNSLMKTLQREEELTYDILIAENGEEALKILNNQPIELVLADHNMPGLKGTELLEKIRLMYPSTIRILITGYSELEMARDAINKARIHFFIEKPPDPQELRNIIKGEILKKRENH